MPMFDRSLDFALAALLQHPSWHLFPIRRFEKDPPLITDNLKQASNDPNQIKAWHAKWPGCNWGVSLKKSGLIVVDVDRKPGKQGQETYDELDLNFGFPETFTVSTPSGGLHLYYNVTAAVPHQYAQGKYGFGTDIDSTNYVLLPGCWLCTGAGYDAITDAPIADAPDWFANYIKPKSATVKDTDTTVPVVDLDQSANVDWFVTYLRNEAPPSVQGQNGEKALFTVAAVAKDHGISEPKAVELIHSIYNDPAFGKCQPPWSLGTGPMEDRLEVKVHNAYTYAVENAPGAATPEAHFGDADADDEMTEPQRRASRIDYSLLDADRRAALSKLADDAMRGVFGKVTVDLTDAPLTDSHDDPPPSGGSGGKPPTTPSPAKDKQKAAARAVANRPANEQARLWSMAEVCDEWVYIANAKRFVWRYDPDFRNYVWDVEGFDLNFAYLRGQSTKFSKRLLERTANTIRKFATMGYKPGEDEFVGELYNLYRPAAIKPIQGDTRLWDEHFNYLFQDPTERDHVLNWLAWLLQHIGEKPRHALLIAGYHEGTGKSFIAEVMRQLLGPHNVAPIGEDELDSTFNEWALKSKLLVVEELQALDRGAIKKKLHPLISQESIIINDKNVKRYKIDNCFGVMAMSNMDAAISLSQTDRRYLVVRTHSTPQDRTYYERLYGKDGVGGMIRDTAALSAIYYQLMTRDLTNYSGQDRAPHTEAKAEMIESGLTDLEHYLVENMGNYPLTCRVTTLADVVESLPAKLQSQPRVRQNVLAFLKHRLNAMPLGQHRIGTGRTGERRSLLAIGKTGVGRIEGVDVIGIYLADRQAGGNQATREAEADFADADE